mgnify:CR=1
MIIDYFSQPICFTFVQIHYKKSQHAVIHHKKMACVFRLPEKQPETHAGVQNF